MAKGLLVILTDESDVLDEDGALTHAGVMAAIDKVTILPAISTKQLQDFGATQLGQVCGNLIMYWLDPSLGPRVENNDNN